MKYTGVKCPVCHEVFDDNSDVVVCPDCGTPHHRDCYNKIGECAFESKHQDNFTFVNPNKPEEPAAPKVEVKEVQKLTKENMPVNGVIGEMGYDQEGNSLPVYREIKGNEKIGNYTVDDYASVVQKNTYKFIPRFLKMDKTDKKVSWNWAAFFLGPLYFAYRKMWKYAIITLLCILIIPAIFMNDINKYYNETYKVYNEVLLSKDYETTDEMNAAIEDAQKKLPPQPEALNAAGDVELVVDILSALFANYLYMQHCTSVLDKSRKIENAEEREKFIKSRGGRSVPQLILFCILVYVVIFGFGLYFEKHRDLATMLRRFIK